MERRMMALKTREKRGGNHLGHGSHGQMFRFYSDKNWKSLEDSEPHRDTVRVTQYSHILKRSH